MDTGVSPAADLPKILRSTPGETKLLTQINDLFTLRPASSQGYQMVSRSVRLLVAAFVLGVINQACAVNSGHRQTVHAAGARAQDQDGPTLERRVSAIRPTAPAAGLPRLVPVASSPARRNPARPEPPLPPSPTIAPAPDARAVAAPAPAVRDEVPARRDDVAPLLVAAETGATPPAQETRDVAPSAQGVPGTASEAFTGQARVQVRLPAGRPAGTSATPGAIPSSSTGAASPLAGTSVGQEPPSPATSPLQAGSQAQVEAAAPPEAGRERQFDSLWTRLRAGFRIPDLESPLVARHEDYYSSRPEYLQRIVERGRRYLHFIVEEVEKRGMPMEIALLPMIESAYNPAAYSKAHASGMWQFIPATGRNYGLQQNWWYDGRRDVLAATRAALDYLQKLHGDFGDWQLALAAYNWGEGAVARAISHNQRRGLPADYSSLPMPTETRNYLPKLQAVKNIVAEPERFGMALDDVPNEPYFIRVAAPGHIDFKRAAQLADVPLEEFRSLNPAFNRPVIASSGEQPLLIPADKADTFEENLRSIDGPLVSWQTYRVTRPEGVDAIAARFGTSTALLRQVNGITSNGRLKPGSALLVPRSTRATRPFPVEAIDTADFQPPQVVAEPRSHRVKRGETLAGIATTYGLTVQQLGSWNRIKGGKPRPGSVLRLQPKAPGAVTTRVARPAAGAHGGSPGPRHHAASKSPSKKAVTARCCQAGGKRQVLAKAR